MEETPFEPTIVGQEREGSRDGIGSRKVHQETANGQVGADKEERVSRHLSRLRATQGRAAGWPAAFSTRCVSEDVSGCKSQAS